MNADGGGFLLACNSCRVAFADSELQRDHYRSDWHRYNLKRRVAELPPVVFSVFQEKLLLHSDENQDKSRSAEGVTCEVCSKSFRSQQTYDNHCSSKKHKEAAKNNAVSERAPTKGTEDDSNVDNVDDDEMWEDIDEENEGIPITECIFCGCQSGSVESSLVHMSVEHGFFVTDINYCIDVDGLLQYLGRKVCQGLMCLWCRTDRRYSDLQSTRQHMRDKGHCKMAHDDDTQLEYTDFYDFSSSYPSVDNAGDDEEMSPTDNEGTPPITEQNWQLVLPSGAVIGHRSLLKYYKQKLKPETAVVRRRRAGEADRYSSVISGYKALGWTGTTGAMAVRKAKDQKFMHRLASKRRLDLGTRAGKLFMDRGRKD